MRNILLYADYGFATHPDATSTAPRIVAQDRETGKEFVLPDIIGAIDPRSAVQGLLANEIAQVLSDLVVWIQTESSEDLFPVNSRLR